MRRRRHRRTTSATATRLAEAAAGRGGRLRDLLRAARRDPLGATRRAAVGTAWRDPRWSWLPAATAAALVAAAYLVLEPRAADLPAHLFRAGLFADEGFVTWSNAWYGGHHVPGYSVLFPPLAWLLGPRLTGALACVAAAILFERLVRGHYGDRARLAALWLGVGIGTLLFTERLTFALGTAIGLGAVLALQRRRPLAAAGIGAASSLASPVAGLFVALAGGAYAVAAATGRPAGASTAGSGAGGPDLRRKVRAGLGLAGAALAPTLLLAIALPEGGEHPLVVSAYVAVPLLAVAALALLPPAERVLRVGAVLYLAGATAALLLATPVGGNVTRLGALLGGPLLAAAVAGRQRTRARTVAIAVVLAGLAYWQLAPAVRATLDASGDPSTEARYYAPLLERLAAERPPGRIEIPVLESHFEAAHVARHHPLARGWERQLDVERNALFYEDGLDHAAYRRWLRRNAVSHVALAEAELDYSARDERSLIEEGPGYLEQVWSSEHWRLFEVRSPRPLASGEDGTEIGRARLQADSFVVPFRTPGAALVRVRWSPHWAAEGACVEPAGEWTRVIAGRVGRLRVVQSFAPGRVLARSRRCS